MLVETVRSVKFKGWLANASREGRRRRRGSVGERRGQRGWGEEERLGSLRWRPGGEGMGSVRWRAQLQS